MVMFADNLPVPMGSSYRSVIENHVSYLRSVVPSLECRIWLAVAEFRAHDCDFDGATTAFSRASESARQSELGAGVLATIQRRRDELAEAAWFAAADRAMRDAVASGTCRLSRSGKSVIFSSPVLGRSDLSGRIGFARAQLAHAGIVA